MQKIFIAYKLEFSRDINFFISMWQKYTDEEGKWLYDWFKKRSFTWIILEFIIFLPWKLSFWWPFLIVAYIWNFFIRYLFLPLLVITADVPYLYKFIHYVEKFLKTFFGFFWILELIPYKLKQKKVNLMKKIDIFGEWAIIFQKHGPEMVDNYFARKRYGIWSWYDSYIKWPLFLFNRKWPLRRIIRRKLITMWILIKIYIRNIPYYLKYKKHLWIYRIKLLIKFFKPRKVKVIIALWKISHYVFLGFWIFFIILQGILLTLELIFIPERFSLWIRIKLNNIKDKIRIYLLKKNMKNRIKSFFKC